MWWLLGVGFGDVGCGGGGWELGEWRSLRRVCGAEDGMRWEVLCCCRVSDDVERKMDGW